MNGFLAREWRAASLTPIEAGDARPVWPTRPWPLPNPYASISISTEHEIDAGKSVARAIGRL